MDKQGGTREQERPKASVPFQDDEEFYSVEQAVRVTARAECPPDEWAPGQRLPHELPKRSSGVRLPEDESNWTYGPEANHLIKLKSAIVAGEVRLLHPDSLEPLAMPAEGATSDDGVALDDAMLSREDLQRFSLKYIGIELVVGHWLMEAAKRRAAGYFTLHEAAKALAQCMRLRDPFSCEELRKQLFEAADSGALAVRDPDTLGHRKVVNPYAALVRRTDVDAWLKRIDCPFRWEEQTVPAPAPLQVAMAMPTLAPADTPPATHETPIDRDDRRYRELKADGGDYVFENGRWHVTGQRGLLATLSRRERAAGRPMSDEKNVRQSLKNGADRAKRAKVAGARGNSAFNQ